MSDTLRICTISPPLFLIIILPSDDQQSTILRSFFAALARHNISALDFVRSSLIHTCWRSPCPVVVDDCRSLELVSPRPHAPACNSVLRWRFNLYLLTMWASTVKVLSVAGNEIMYATMPDEGVTSVSHRFGDRWWNCPNFSIWLGGCPFNEPLSGMKYATRTKSKMLGPLLNITIKSTIVVRSRSRSCGGGDICGTTPA